MALCTECGAFMEDGAKFCGRCGAKMKINPTPVQTSSSQPKHSSTRRSQIETVYEGNIHKCPNCGETIKSFTTVCPSCGLEFREINPPSVVKKFANKLERLQSQKQDPSILPKKARAIAEAEANSIEKQIQDMIRNFFVPNTKEDVFEFMILASSNINTAAIEAESASDVGANSEEELNAIKARNDAWFAKVEQVFTKARVAFGSDPEFSKIQDIYERTTNAVGAARKEKKKKNRKDNMALALIGVLAISGWIGIFAIILLPGKIMEHKLEAIVEEVKEDVAAGNYDAALIKANGLRFDASIDEDRAKQWDEQREDLIEFINEKKSGK